MSELKKGNRYDYSKYDEMSTEALKEILRLDFQMSEETKSDISAILYILEVIAEREKDSPDVEAARERFNTKYRPYVTDGLSLYDFGDEDSTPEIIPNNPVAESNSPTSNVDPQLKRQGGTRRLVRLAVVAAILAAFLIATSATAYALGFDLWGTIAQWTRETFSFVSPSTSTSDVNMNLVKNPSEEEYASLQDALTAYGITESLVPTWIPDGFIMRSVSISEDAKPECVIFSTCYKQNDKAITVQINMYHNANSVDYTVWQKDEIDIDTMEVNNCVFYLMENAGRWSAAWTSGAFECNITGDISLDELTRIIESIYKKDE